MEKNKPIYSIILPAYNEEQNISVCLSSLSNQTIKLPYEIIVINNNSEDHTAEIASHFPLARVINEPKKGRWYARTTGLKHSKGSILLFTEADCIVPQNWIERYDDYFKNPSIAGVAGSYRYSNSTPFLSNIQPIASNLDSHFYKWFYGTYVFKAANFGIRSSILKKLNGFSPYFTPFDDTELGLRVGKMSKIIYDPNLLVKTSDRRLRGRVVKYFFSEFLPNFLRVSVFRTSGVPSLWTDIR